MKKGPISEAETQKIRRLHEGGMAADMIAFLLHRRVDTVCSIIGEKKPELDKNDSKQSWLEKNWQWKPPEEQVNALVKVKRKRRKKTNFRTPYSYPRLWEQERRDYED